MLFLLFNLVVAQECLSDFQCSRDKPYCNNGICEKCINDLQCRNDNTCDAICFNHTCVSRNLECNNNETCYKLEGVCKTSCLISNCSDNKFCFSDKKCYDCIYQKDCPPNTLCRWVPETYQTICSHSSILSINFILILLFLF